VEEHLDKADEDGDLIPLQTLFKGIGDRADRFGYSKKTINTNIQLRLRKAHGTNNGLARSRFRD